MSWGQCTACGARADLGYQPGSNPPKRVCANCYQPLPREHANPTPTFDDYFEAARALATAVREAIDYPKAVKRGEIRKALEAFERIDKAT